VSSRTVRLRTNVDGAACNILSGSYRLKVSWVYTAALPAEVITLQVISYRPDQTLVRNAVRAKRSSSNLKLSVSVGKAGRP
jgi:hypothetical protein